MRTRDVRFLESSAIQSLEILKDAASASIYGAEGANGVVLISTKDGTKWDSGIEYTAQFGTQMYRGKMELMNSDEYISYLNTAGDTTFVGQGANTDWLDELFEPAPIMRHQLTFSGGDDQLSYSLGGSYFDRAGIIGGKDRSRFERAALNLGLRAKVKPFLELGLNASYANEQSKGSAIFGDQNVGGIVSSAILMDPTTPVVYNQEDGAAAIEANIDNGPLSTDEDGNVYGISQLVGGEVINPFVYLDQINGDGNKSNRLFASACGRLGLLENLSFTSRIGADMTNGLFHNWSPSYYYSTERQSATPFSMFNKFDSKGIQWENFLTYDLDFGDAMDISFLAGQSIYSNTTTFLNVFAGGLVANANEVSYADGSEASTDLTGGKSEQRLQSFFGRINFNIQDKYLVMASLRRDGTSLFTEDNRFKTYPGVSVGWVLSREDFFNNSGHLNFVKLRASWGQTGSLSGVPPGAGQAGIGFAYRIYDAADNAIVVGESSELSNPDLTWETSEQTDIGIDFGFFQDRLSFSVDWFQKLTKDLIATSSAPGYIGNAPPLFNAGTMSNKGMEFELAYRNNDNAVNYQLSANLTTLKNEVTEVNSGSGQIQGSQNARVGTSWVPTVFEQGQPAWYFSGYQSNGLDESGNLQLVDLNEDGVIDAEDQTYIGDPHPDLIYGAGVNLEYKKFDFTLFVQGQMGNDILVGYLREDRATQNRPTYMNDADFFAPTLNVGNSLRSDKMIFDGSFTRVKQIQLGYSIDGRDNRFDNCRIFVSLEDYFTFTSYTGLEPEVGSSFNDAAGIDRGVYPIPGRVMLGASLKF